MTLQSLYFYFQALFSSNRVNESRVSVDKQIRLQRIFCHSE